MSDPTETPPEETAVQGEDPVAEEEEEGVEPEEGEEDLAEQEEEEAETQESQEVQSPPT